jgi:hypothetical protein
VVTERPGSRERRIMNGERYLDGHRGCGLKVGDKVKVIRTAEDFEQGWKNSWTGPMYRRVGQTCTITGDDAEYGFTMDSGFGYPYFVLEKVEEPAEAPSNEPRDAYDLVAAGDCPQPITFTFTITKNDPTHKTNADGTLVKSEYSRGGLEFL